MNSARISLLEGYIEEEPENPFNRYALAMEYYDENPPRALALLGELCDSFPSYLPTYFKLAHLLWEEENWEKAEKTFLSGIQLAENLGETKTLAELKSAYQNFIFEK